MNFAWKKSPTSWLKIALLSAALPMLLKISAVSLAAESASPFLITVDGRPLAGSQAPEDVAWQNDKALAGADIQVKFDGLGAAPVLNVSTAPVRAAYRAGEEVRFYATHNYPAFTVRGEILIFKKGKARKGQPLNVLTVSKAGTAVWNMPEGGPDELEYVYRVYDAEGRYDQTKPLGILRTGRDLKQHSPQDGAIAPGYGEDRTDFRNIPVYGGAVTVYGKNIPADHDVYVMGELVPVDGDNAFLVQRIMPTGNHKVTIDVVQGNKGLHFERAIEIPRNEWFYVVQADATALYRTGDPGIEQVKTGEYDKVITNGRLAFYLKGKIRGRYILTASADSGEGEIKDLITGMDGKSPRAYLDRIDPDSFYPVYGDDSSAVEDAPTRGKFYVRLDDVASHVMWGTFKTNITGTKFLQSNRELYGAGAVYRSEGTTRDGAAVTALDGYAAQPGTLPQRDMFRGTGGSAYFLKHQDVTPGSETVTIEVQNRVSGLVIERRILKAGEGYDIDYVQGVLILRSPLPSSNASGSTNYLVADYEYTPAAGEPDGYAVGGRAEQWLGDHVRLGVTGGIEKTGAADQKLAGADIRVQADPGTYLEAEIARSDGPGFGKTYSSDGGLTSDLLPSSGQKNVTAYAYRGEGKADLETLTGGKIKGDVQAYYERSEAGFSSLTTDVPKTREIWGGRGTIEIARNAEADLRYDEQSIDGGSLDREAAGRLKLPLSGHVRAEPYLVYSDRERQTAVAKDTGERGDGGLKLAYAWDENTEAYVFGQGTFALSGDRRRDDRGGVGGRAKITEKVGAEGEISEGTLGLGASATLDYTPTADDRYYLGYRLDPERAGSADWPFALEGDDLGTIVGGARRRINDKTTAFAEDNYDIFGERQSLMQAYGVTYTPDAKWTLEANAEVGSVFDNTKDPATGSKNYSFDRTALSSGVIYRGGNGLDAKVRGEVRFDNSENDARDRDSYLVSSGLGLKMSEDWRALASLDAVFTSATDTTLKGQFAEGSIGFAYRPARNDKLNALFKYIALYDEPGADQVGADGTTDSPYQVSNILSADINYDLIKQLTIGAKYGLRLGRSRDRAPGSDWSDATANLGILRADIHVVHDWDALVEGRVLWLPESDSTHLGAIAAVYRHLGDHAKLGLGYNFGSFSDDLRDQTLNDQGVFINLLGEW